MRIISKTIESSARISFPDLEVREGEVLFLDIATTGIKRADCRVYMIGCICRQHGEWQLTQWFDDTGLEEKHVLSSFLIFCSPFKYAVTYNGNRFDLPFLRVRIEANGLQETAAAFLSMNSIDLPGE